MGTKKGPQRFATSPFGCHYSRDIMLVLFQTLSHLLYASFLRRTLCLSILSLCLPRDVHFQHDFQLQKTQFLQLFPPFSSACPPLRFSHSDGIFAHGIPHQNPLHFPHSSSLSGGILRSHLLPSNSPCLLPFQSVRQAEFIPKTRRFRSKLKPFQGESSPAQGRRKGLFRGILEYFGSKNQPRSGRFGGKTGENFRDFSAVESP